MNLIGDRQRFALGFELRPDPDPAGAPHLRASWGQLQIWVAGRNLTAGQAADGSSLVAAEVPLAPMVSWLADNWDPLLHEERLPDRSRSTSAAAWRTDGLTSLPDDDDQLDTWMTARDGWWCRHGLGSALPEYRVPDLHIRRLDDEIELSWDDREWRSVPGGVRMIEMPGACRLPALEVAQCLYEWTNAVLDALACDPLAEAFTTQVRQKLESAAGPVIRSHGSSGWRGRDWKPRPESSDEWRESSVATSSTPCALSSMYLAVTQDW